MEPEQLRRTKDAGVLSSRSMNFTAFCKKNGGGRKRFLKLKVDQDTETSGEEKAGTSVPLLCLCTAVPH